jgi:hypothetical protein
MITVKCRMSPIMSYIVFTMLSLHMHVYTVNRLQDIVSKHGKLD